MRQVAGASPRERVSSAGQPAQPPPSQAVPFGSPAQPGEAARAAREGYSEGLDEGPGAAPDSPDGEGLGEGEAGGYAGVTPAQSLQLENARLRTELAEQVPRSCQMLIQRLASFADQT